MEGALFDMRGAGIGQGGCRPKTSNVMEGKPGATVVHKKATKERATQTEDDECLECDVREKRMASLKAELRAAREERERLEHENTRLAAAFGRLTLGKPTF